MDFYGYLNNWDYFIIFAYLFFVIALGIFLNKKNQTKENYFLAGRNLTWPLIGFSLFASNMGSISLVGLAESGYSSGFANFSYEWMAAIVLIIFAVFFLPFYLKNRIYTIPEFLELRYGVFARYYFSVVTMLLNVFIDVAAGLYAGAVVIKLAFPSLHYTEIIWVIAIIAAFYTLMGGLKSVVYTDMLQAILLIIGSIIITIIALEKVGGWQSIVQQVDDGFLSIIKPVNDKSLPWPGLFSGVFLLGFYFWATNQFIAQRALASKSIKHGQWGSIFAGFLKLITLFIMVLPGVIALILYPDLKQAKDAYPKLLFELLPHGLLGLTLAGFIAALMSSVDSGLNAASTLFSFDIYKKIKPKVKEKELLLVAKIMILVLMVLSAIWAPFINKFDSFWDYLQMVLSFLCPPIVALFIFGLFSKKVNVIGANIAIVTGIFLSIMSFVYKAIVQIYQIKDVLPHYLYLAGIIFIICTLVLFVFSFINPIKQNKDWSRLIWTRAYFNKETESLKNTNPWTNYRYQAILLAILVIVLLIIF